MMTLGKLQGSLMGELDKKKSLFLHSTDLALMKEWKKTRQYC